MQLVLLTCQGGDGVTITNAPIPAEDMREVPHCPSGAAWQVVDSNTLSFDLIDWLQTPANQVEFAGFFGAGFCLVAVARLIGWSVRQLLSMINS